MSQELEAQEWIRQFTVEAERVDEYVELYKSLGNEVRVEPVTPDLMVDEKCATCALAVCDRYVVIYTRPRDVECEMWDMSQKYKFYYPLRVRYVETDAQRHVFFGHYLTYFDVGLTEYMRAIGCHYPDMVASGVDMFYVEASCQYKGRAYFDDLLHVHTRIGHIGNTSFTFEFAIYKQPTDELIATGKIVAVAVDVKTEQPVRVPDELREAVAWFEEKKSS